MKKVCFAVIAFLAPIFGASGEGVIADLARDWSNAVNGNNGWTYNAGNVPLPFQPSWLGLPAWAPGVLAPNLSPGVFKLASAGTLSAQLDLQVNDVCVLSADPQNSGSAGVANVKWTSSVSGTIEIRGRVWNAALLQALDNQYMVKLNGMVLTSGTIHHLTDTRSHPLVIAQNATVQAGDVLEFDFVKPASQELGTFSGVSLSITQSQGTRILPQFAFGGGWDTTLYFTAAPDAPASLTVNFNSDTGTPLNVPAFGGTFAHLDIPAGGTAVLEAPNEGPLVQGYALVELPAGVSGYAVFRQTVPGRPDQEASIPFMLPGSPADLIWDDTAFTTAVAIVNLSSNPNPVTLTARGPDGNVIGSSQVIISADGKLAATLLSFPGLAGIVGRRGALEITGTSGPIAVTALRFAGSAFTGIPVN